MQRVAMRADRLHRHGEGGVIRVLLADGQVLARAGIKSLLQQMDDVEIVAEADNGADAVALAGKHLPDVVLLDISLPVMSGLQATREIKRRFPFVNVVIVTTYVNETYVEQALRAGASGYLLKDAEILNLAPALAAVKTGAIHLGPHAARQLVENCLSRAPEAGREAASEIPLTARQREILRCIAEGLTGKEIGQRLGISPKTVEGHRTQLMHRLHIHDVPGLVRYAIRIGLIVA